MVPRMPSLILMHRWLYSMPSWFTFGSAAATCFLFLCDRFQWLPFNCHKGWTVLIAVASTAALILIWLLCLVFALVYRLRFQFSVGFCPAAPVVVALPLGWLAAELRRCASRAAWSKRSESRRQRSPTTGRLTRTGFRNWTWPVPGQLGLRKPDRPASNRELGIGRNPGNRCQLGNRETLETPASQDAGRSGKALCRTPDMHVVRESDGPIVPKKRANKAGLMAAAESVEGRGSTKGNAERTLLAPDSGPGKRGMGLRSVREAAKRDKKLRFTALLHHITAEMLQDSYFELKRMAAPGVDGVTWHA